MPLPKKNQACRDPSGKPSWISCHGKIADFAAIVFCFAMRCFFNLEEMLHEANLSGCAYIILIQKCNFKQKSLQKIGIQLMIFLQITIFSVFKPSKWNCVKQPLKGVGTHYPDFGRHRRTPVKQAQIRLEGWIFFRVVRKLLFFHVG